MSSSADFKDEETTKVTEPARPPVEPEAGPPRLIGLTGPQEGRKYPVRGNATIGRTADATFPIDDQHLSRMHARILLADDGTYILEDLDSRNGTYVNDVRIERRVLRFGDVLRLGASTFLFTHHNPHEEQIAQRHKTEILGRLGAGVAHDFNNMLGVAMASLGNLALLPQSRTMADADVRECLIDIETSLRRAAELTARLLGLARQGGFVYERVDLTQLCHEVAGLLRRTLPQSIRIEQEIDPGLTTKGDRGQIHQVLMNLAINARDAMPGGGVLRLGARRVPAGGPSAVPGSRGDRIALTVTDSGVGMDAEARQRAFEPFFTTKASGQGTGLGLSAVLEIVRVHGGTVDFVSETGKGTTFFVYLPASPGDASGATRTGLLRAIPADAAAHQRGGAARILLADDDAAVRRSLGRLLGSQGHEILLACDGEEAVEVYQAERPDLVLLDLDMPVMTGREALRRLLEVDPAVRAIFISGHWEEGITPGPDATSGLLGFLQKPCTPADLQRVIARALAAPAR